MKPYEATLGPGAPPNQANNWDTAETGAYTVLFPFPLPALHHSPCFCWLVDAVCSQSKQVSESTLNTR